MGGKVKFFLYSYTFNGDSYPDYILTGIICCGIK